jgi:hypothetical protein
MAEGLVQPANILASPLIDIALHKGLYKPRDMIRVLILPSWPLDRWKLHARKAEDVS